MVHPFACEKVWFDKSKVEEAESRFYSLKYSGTAAASSGATSSIASDIKHIKDRIHSVLTGSAADSDSLDMQRLATLEDENRALRSMIEKLEARVKALELGGGGAKPAVSSAAAPKPAAKDDSDSDSEEVDLFGSDDEVDEEAERIKQERLAAYAAKKSKKPALIAKSSILLDVKPWDDETDMVAMEKCVRSIQMDGLLWGQAKLVPIGYGIKKLQIGCVVEDDKVGTDDLEEKIVAFEDFVQSVDVAAFNKI
jgi:translation elongation factor EF-1beta